MSCPPSTVWAGLSLFGPGTHYSGPGAPYLCRVLPIWAGYSLSGPITPYLCRVLPICAGYSLSGPGTPYLCRVLPICVGYSLSGPGTPYLCRVLPIWAGYSLSVPGTPYLGRVLPICAGYSLSGPGTPYLTVSVPGTHYLGSTPRRYVRSSSSFLFLRSSRAVMLGLRCSAVCFALRPFRLTKSMSWRTSLICDRQDRWDRTGDRQDRWQTGQVTDRTGDRQDRWQTGQVTDRTGDRQDRWQTGQVTDRWRSVDCIIFISPAFSYSIINWHNWIDYTNSEINMAERQLPVRQFKSIPTH